MENILIKVGALEDQFNDIMEHFGAEISLECSEKINKYGGNSEYAVTLNGKTSKFPFKEKIFTYQPQAQTLSGFINEIKAYFVDMVDSCVNLL